MRKLTLVAAFAALAVGAPAHAQSQAQKFPEHAVKIIVGFPPGAGSDNLARFMGKGLSEIWKQPVVIENRPGAGGNIAAEAVAKAPPDGYALLLYNNSYAMNVATTKTLPFDVSKDFAPVGTVAISSMLVIVNNDLPAKNVKELVALAKAKPGSLNVGSSGIGTPQHLAAELFKSMAGVDMTHVPYKGAVPSVTGLMGNEIQVLFGPTGSVLPFVKDNRVRAIGITTLKRSPDFPDIGTVAEAGYEGFDVGVVYGMLAPRGTPPDIVRKIARDLASLLDNPDNLKYLSNSGLDPTAMSPEAFDKQIKGEVARWLDVGKRAKLQQD